MEIKELIQRNALPVPNKYDEAELVEFKDAEERREIGRMWLDRLEVIKEWRKDDIDGYSFDTARMEANKNYNDDTHFFQIVETIKSNVHHGKPKPYVEPKPADNHIQNELNRKFANIIKTCLNDQLDNGKLNSAVTNLLTNGLVDGFGVIQVEIETPNERNPDYKFKFKTLSCKDIYLPPAPCFEDVTHAFIRHSVSEVDLGLYYDTDFKSDMGKISDTPTMSKESDETDEYTRTNKHIIWEVQDKVQGQKIFIREKDGLALSREKDIFNLMGFFNFTRPLMYGWDCDMRPRPMWINLRDNQKRISNLEKKVDDHIQSACDKGFESLTDLKAMTKEMRDEYIKQDKPKLYNVPNLAKETWLEGIKPSDLIVRNDTTQAVGLVQAFTQEILLYQQKMDKRSGVMDLMQGTSNPNEGVKTQILKSEYALNRLRPFLMQFHLCLTDVMQISAELIHNIGQERGGPEYLAQKAGIDLDLQTNQGLYRMFQDKAFFKYSVDIDEETLVRADTEDNFKAAELLDAMDVSLSARLEKVPQWDVKERYFLYNRQLLKLEKLPLSTRQRNNETRLLEQKLKELQKNIDAWYDPNTGELNEEGMNKRNQMVEDAIATTPEKIKLEGDKEIAMSNNQLKQQMEQNAHEFRMGQQAAQVQKDAADSARADQQLALDTRISTLELRLKDKTQEQNYIIDKFESELKSKEVAINERTQMLEAQIEKVRLQLAIMTGEESDAKNIEIKEPEAIEP